MGVPLVEGQDLVVENDIVRMKTTAGLKRVDVIYRRMNDDFLDPEALRPDSLIGVPGLLRAFRKGTLALANAIGNGVADDKATYAYMPRIIKYYLDEEPILPNVETNICREQHALSYTLDHLEELVVKPVGESGGYGLTVGPTATRAELEACRARLISDPANFISQPMIKLSVCPTLTEEGIAARHVDLRPFAVTGQSTFVLPGGLTRVAFLDPLLGRAALIVECDDPLGGSAQVGYNEPDARVQLTRMPLELGDDAAGFVPGRGLIAEAGMIPANIIGRPADGAFQQMGDAALQHLVCGEPDGVAEVLGFEKLVDFG